MSLLRPTSKHHHRLGILHRDQGQTSLPKMALMRTAWGFIKFGPAALLILVLVASYLQERSETPIAHWRTLPQNSRAPESINQRENFWAYEEAENPTTSMCKSWRQRIDLSPFRTLPPPRRHPRPVLGLEDLYRNDQCFTYQSRYERYTDSSLNFTYREPAGLDALLGDIHVDEMGAPIRPATKSVEQWVAYLKARNRFINSHAISLPSIQRPSWRALMDGCGLSTRQKRPKRRTAILLRFYEGYVMTEDEVLNTRALIVEMSLSRPEQGWDVRILVETKSIKHAFATREAKERILSAIMPREFWGLAEFWSEPFVELLLPGLETGPSNAWRGAYNQDRGCIIASQIFSLLHPEYDFVYNWESDIRFIGDNRLFFDAIERFAKDEPLEHGLNKYTHWYIRDSEGSHKDWFGDHTSTIGKGKEADLIVFNPMFEVSDSGWWYDNDFQNISLTTPRRASIVSSLRMSRDLVKGMNLAAAESKKSMSCEAWPVTAALHTHFPPSSDLMYEPNSSFLHELDVPFKAVFVPHPVYFDEIFTTRELEDHLWVDEFMAFEHEDFMQGSSYYYTSHQAWKIYSDWKEGLGHNRCRKAALLHPVKTRYLLGDT